MQQMTFAEAIETALVQAMEDDQRVVVIGEDVAGLRMNLFARLGQQRVRPAPAGQRARSSTFKIRRRGSLFGRQTDRQILERCRSSLQPILCVRGNPGRLR